MERLNNPIMMNFLKTLILLFLLLLLAACAAPDAAAPRAASITCHTAYRSSSGVPIEEEDTLTFAASDAADALSYTDLTFHAQYNSGEMNRERALRLWVTETGQSDELTSQLYQLPLDSGPQNQFIGGHGFSGLNYVYHPASGAELQFWCTAE